MTDTSYDDFVRARLDAGEKPADVEDAIRAALERHAGGWVYHWGVDLWIDYSKRQDDPE